MTYGKLTLITGPMFAGKTSELLRRILWAKSGTEQTIFVAKPAFDNRYAATKIVSHDGLSAVARSLGGWDTVAELLAGEAECLFFDEIQFFTPEHGFDDFPETVRRYLGLGKNIVCNGLDMDWQGQPFDVTARLAAMADEVLKLNAHCTCCGKPARKTYKIISEGGSVELGAADVYEARCNEHWAARTPRAE
jgi:thymidine kinase